MSSWSLSCLWISTKTLQESHSSMVSVVATQLDFGQSLRYDFWHRDTPERVQLTCLLPNGIVVDLPSVPNATIKEIKEVITGPDPPSSMLTHLMTVHLFTGTMECGGPAAVQQIAGRKRKVYDNCNLAVCTIRRRHRRIQTPLWCSALFLYDTSGGEARADWSALRLQNL